jgi:hypothetical protein
MAYGAYHRAGQGSWGNPVPRGHSLMIEKESLKGGLWC